MRRPRIAALAGALLAALVLAAAVFGGHAWRERARRAAGPEGRVESPAAIAIGAGRLQDEIAALAPQRPGHPDLYVLGIAGDGSERVFLNEVRHLRDVAERRLDAGGRVLVLANHAPEVPYRAPVPATRATIRAALAGLGRTMDPAEDILLLYATTHGSEDHWLLLRRPGLRDGRLGAEALRAALDDAGIRHRVLALSACYSGGLAPPLQTPDTLVLTAAREDRTSFGCGNDSVATFFGRAWLVDGLNATVDFASAFRQARKAIGEREAADDYEPSRPQIREGARIGARLRAWRAGFRPGPPVPYPHTEPVQDEDEGDPAWVDDDDTLDDVFPPLLPMSVLTAREAAAREADADGDADRTQAGADPLSEPPTPPGDTSSKP